MAWQQQCKAVGAVVVARVVRVVVLGPRLDQGRTQEQDMLLAQEVGRPQGCSGCAWQ